MPPEETSAPEVSQPAPESPSPAVEVQDETPPPEAVPSTPEPAPAPAEAVPPALGTDQSPSQTGQIGGNDPLPSKSDPIQPPSSAAPAQAGILHTAPSVAKAMEGTRDLLNKARITIQDRKRKKRDKIMEALTKKNKITNDEVEKLLHVSDATAERYLAVLVKEGKLKQEKRTGAGVSYTKI